VALLAASLPIAACVQVALADYACHVGTIGVNHLKVARFACAAIWAIYYSVMFVEQVQHGRRIMGVLCVLVSLVAAWITGRVGVPSAAGLGVMRGLASRSALQRSPERVVSGS
jgi:uncharacterized membrane protein